MTLKLLADENQHPKVIARLREAGFEVEAVKETMPGADDVEILSRPDIGSLVVITYDRDLGDLIFKHGMPAPAALLYTRISRLEPSTIATRLLMLLASGITTDHITTITQGGERLKPFPSGAANA